MTVDKSGPRVRRMFGEIAGRYDFLNHLLSLNVDRYWRWRTVRLVPPRPGTQILDVCTGTGDLALAYHEAAGGQRGDRRRRFLPRDAGDRPAEGRRRPAPTAQLTFVEADAQALPVASDQFDIVCVAFGLRNVADTDAGLAEMTRACAPAGGWRCWSFRRRGGSRSRRFTAGIFATCCRGSGSCSPAIATSAYSYLPESVGEFPQGEALAERMRAAGLTDVSYRGLTFGVATLYVGVKKASACSRAAPRSRDEPLDRVACNGHCTRFDI